MLNWTLSISGSAADGDMDSVAGQTQEKLNHPGVQQVDEESTDQGYEDHGLGGRSIG